MKATILYYNDLATGGTSDKEYRAQITKNGSGYQVQYQFGKRGGTMQPGVHRETKEPVPLEEAERIYDKLVNEKLSKGYVGTEAAAFTTAPTILSKAVAKNRTPYPQEELEEVGIEVAEVLVKDNRYLMQLKANGHFRQGEKLTDGSVVSYNKKGEAKPFPPEVEKELAKLTLKTFFFDGELVGTTYFIFQMLHKNGKCFKALPFVDRLRHATDVIPEDSPYIKVIATWNTTKEKQGGLALCRKARCEGVCFKLKDAPYRAGNSGVHKKFKFLKTCTCKVMELGTSGKENARLGLLKDGKWIEVAGASMIGKDKRIAVGSLVEVTFLYFTGSRLCQPRITELRDDVRESDCTFERQIKKSMYQEGVAA